jgi:hypothetical protein
MDTIGKFRTNFLGKGRSFKIGFNNRSPFSYISTTGPAVPATYDGGVPLVNFEPSDYARAFDTSDAVRAEHEMFKKAGEVAGKVAGAVGSAVVGGIAGGIKGGKAAKGDGFGKTLEGIGKGILSGGKKGLTDPPKLSDKARKRVDDGMSDIRKRPQATSSGGGSNRPIQPIIQNIMPGGGGGGSNDVDYSAIFDYYADKYKNATPNTPEQSKLANSINDCMNKGGTFDSQTGNCSK